MIYAPILYSVILSGREGNILYLTLVDSEVIFALIAILVLCFFDMLEFVKKLNTTLVSIIFMFWLVTIMFGIGSYTYSKTTEDAVSVTYIVASLVVTTVKYLIFNAIIANAKIKKEV